MCVLKDHWVDESTCGRIEGLMDRSMHGWMEKEREPGKVICSKFLKCLSGVLWQIKITIVKSKSKN